MIHTFVVKILPRPDKLPLRHASPALHGLLMDVASGDQFPFTSGEILLALLRDLTTAPQPAATAQQEFTSTQ